MRRPGRRRTHLQLRRTHRNAERGRRHAFRLPQVDQRDSAVRAGHAGDRRHRKHDQPSRAAEHRRQADPRDSRASVVAADRQPDRAAGRAGEARGSRLLQHREFHADGELQQPAEPREADGRRQPAVPRRDGNRACPRRGEPERLGRRRPQPHFHRRNELQHRRHERRHDRHRQPGRRPDRDAHERRHRGHRVQGGKGDLLQLGGVAFRRRHTDSPRAGRDRRQQSRPRLPGGGYGGGSGLHRREPHVETLLPERLLRAYQHRSAARRLLVSRQHSLHPEPDSVAP